MNEKRFKLIEFWRNNRIISRITNPTLTKTIAETWRLPEGVSVSVWF